MKSLKRFYKVFVMVLMISVLAPTALPVGNVAIAQAATVKLSKKTLSLEVGKSSTLKISGTKSKVTWTTSKKSIATVSNGKVTGKKVGTATITATVNKKKYTCKVTVKEKDLVKNAPFDAQKVTFGDFTAVMPKDWTQDTQEQGTALMALLTPSTADMAIGTSNVLITISETGTTPTKYSEAKEYLQGIITEEFLTTQYALQGVTATVKNLKQSDYKAELGTAFKSEFEVEFNVEEQAIRLTQVVYDLYIGNHLVEVTITDMGDKVKPDVYKVGEYLLNSIKDK
jgi:hypothetical protein